MVDKGGGAAADRLIEKLTEGKFSAPLSQDSEEDYAAFKQERDSRAVADFVETDLFKDIMALK